MEQQTAAAGIRCISTTVVGQQAASNSQQALGTATSKKNTEDAMVSRQQTAGSSRQQEQGRAYDAMGLQAAGSKMIQAAG